MSVDLIVLLDRHAPEASPDWLRQRISADSGALASVVEHYRAWWRVQEWEQPSRDDTGHANLRGPGGFSIRFERHTVEIYHVIPFWRFASDVAVHVGEAESTRCLVHRITRLSTTDPRTSVLGKFGERIDAVGADFLRHLGGISYRQGPAQALSLDLTLRW